MSATLEIPRAMVSPVPPPSSGFGAAVSAAAAEIVARVRASVPVVVAGNGNGAGVIWRSDGQIVTNKHVARSDRVDVVLSDGRKFTGIVAARHPHRDLAVIKIAAEGLPAVEVGDSSTVKPGQIVIAIGHPIGFREAATTGIVVAAGQAATEGGPRHGDFLQTDVTLLPGNSGGPLVDAWGRVIAINTMVNGRLSLAIPSQAVERFVDGGSRGTAAYLGINGIVVATRRVDYPVGFLITEVIDGTPADRAGMIVGDVVVSIGERAVTDQESLPATLLRLVPGEPVELATLRGGEPRTFVVVPTERAGP